MNDILDYKLKILKYNYTIYAVFNVFLEGYKNAN